MLTGCPSASSDPPAPPAVPANVSATAKDGYVLIAATLDGNTKRENVYWSTTAGVTTATGTKVQGGSNPLAINGLSNSTKYYFIVTAVGDGGESAASVEVSATPAAATVAVDPLYADQWHLKNTGQKGLDPSQTAGAVGEDLDVEPAWTTTKGQGVTVAVVDDGLEIGHEDLASNLAANSLSYNYVNGTNDPTNTATDITSGHGTAVAGIIAARDDNGLGGKGVAPRASLAGYNLLQSSVSSNEADAMTRNDAQVSVSSNSWGAPDGEGELYASTSLWKAAIDSGTSSGRGGKGVVYLWAAGNGGKVKSSTCPYGCDDSNYDGRANYHGVLAVAAVNDQGKESSYSEQGANLWLSAPGGEFCYPATSYTTNQHAISTTDRGGDVGFNRAGSSNVAYDYPATGSTASRNYTRCMNGTSSATPAVAGVVALILAANPQLGWRDVRWILAKSARKNDTSDSGWLTNQASFHFNHKYGFGVADASAAVTMAKDPAYVQLGTEKTYSTALSSPNIPIPDYSQRISDGNPKPAEDTINVTGSGMTAIEYVEVTFTATNKPYIGDLAVDLIAPSGTVSHLARQHVCPADQYGACNSTYTGWVFGDAVLLGEGVDGAWKLSVTDWVSDAVSSQGNFLSWKIKFYGH